MIHYFDSSALVKKYIREAGTEKVLTALTAASLRATSKLAYPEILSCLARKRRDKELSDADHRKAVTAFEADWRTFAVLEFQDELLPLMKQLSARHPLKGADLVHFASLLWLQKATREPATLVASDMMLLRAAKAETVETFNPEE